MREENVTSLTGGHLVPVRERGRGGWIDVHVMKRIKTIVGSKPTH